MLLFQVDRANSTSVYVQPPFLRICLMLWIRKHPTSPKGYETSTWMVFHTILAQVTKYCLIRTSVLLLVLNFLSVLFFRFFQAMYPVTDDSKVWWLLLWQNSSETINNAHREYRVLNYIVKLRKNTERDKNVFVPSEEFDNWYPGPNYPYNCHQVLQPLALFSLPSERALNTCS